MRPWVLVVAAALAVACGGTQGGAAHPSGEQPSQFASSPTPSPEQPIVLSGKNSLVTNPIEIPAGHYGVSWQVTYTGGNGQLFLVYVEGQAKVNIVNETLPATDHGEVTYTSAGGRFTIEVVGSSTTWTITFTESSP